jgi:hypothetical protein
MHKRNLHVSVKSCSTIAWLCLTYVTGLLFFFESSNSKDIKYIACTYNIQSVCLNNNPMRVLPTFWFWAHQCQHVILTRSAKVFYTIFLAMFHINISVYTFITWKFIFQLTVWCQRISSFKHIKIFEVYMWPYTVTIE